MAVGACPGGSRREEEREEKEKKKQKQKEEMKEETKEETKEKERVKVRGRVEGKKEEGGKEGGKEKRGDAESSQSPHPQRPVHNRRPMIPRLFSLQALADVWLLCLLTEEEL